MIDKILNAVAEMQKAISFTNKGHTYKNIETGEFLQGVSTVSSIVPKGWLSAWGAKEAVKFLGYSDYEGDTETAKRIMGEISAMYGDDNIAAYVLLLKEAKGASSRKSKTALVDGKAGHLWLETYVQSKINKTELPTMPEGMLKRPLEQFIDWETANVKEWILCETLVAYPEKGYAGTLDGVALMNTGRYAVIDFKFASHISEDYYLQTAGYQATFEPYGIKIDDRIIIRLPKTLMIEEWDKEKHEYKMVENNIEVEIVNTPYELDRDTFFHCLPVKKWINFITKKEKK